MEDLVESGGRTNTGGIKTKDVRVMGEDERDLVESAVTRRV